MKTTISKDKMPQDHTPQKKSLADQIKSSLINDISTGVIKPGERLDETKLAERFGASRTPVREALNRLLAQDVLVSGEKRGVLVAEYSTEELAQMFETMYEIEAACARMASQRLTLLSRTRIETAQQSCLDTAQTGDVSAYLKANEAFHLAIYHATGNQFIIELATDFRHRTGPFRAKRFQSKDDLIASAKSHDTLINSIFSADSNTADLGMRSHMTDSIVKVLKVHS